MYKEYESMSDTEKMVDKLEDIESSLGLIESALIEIDNKLLHNETPYLLRAINNTIGVLVGYLIIFGIIFIFT